MNATVQTAADREFATALAVAEDLLAADRDALRAQVQADRDAVMRDDEADSPARIARHVVYGRGWFDYVVTECRGDVDEAVHFLTATGNGFDPDYWGPRHAAQAADHRRRH